MDIFLRQTLRDAMHYNRMEELEFQAHLQILLGPDAESLPDDEIDKLREIR